MKSRPRAGRLPPIAGRVRAGFVVREMRFEPAEERAYDDADWRGALVIVERGAIELEWLGGARRRFIAGDPLWLDGLRLRLLRNPGLTPAVLSATSRNLPRR